MAPLGSLLRGKKQNGAHFYTYCKGCVIQHQLLDDHDSEEELPCILVLCVTKWKSCMLKSLFGGEVVALRMQQALKMKFAIWLCRWRLLQIRKRMNILMMGLWKVLGMTMSRIS
jgi:hypothetical protein